MRNIIKLLLVAISVSLFAAACGGGGGGGGGTGPVTPDSAKSITDYSFTSPAATGTINESARTIKVNVPSGTAVTALVAAFTTTGKSVKVGSTLQVSGATPNNFTSAVTYTVTAADGSSQSYTVTVTIGPLQAEWARTVSVGDESTSSQSYLNSVVTGTDGSVYAAGSVNGYATFDFGNLVTAAVGTYSGNNGLLVKYNSAGTAQWAKTVSVPNNANTSSFGSLALASDGSLYAAGGLHGPGPFDFGNGVITIPTYTTGSNVLLVKYDSSGTAQWARTVTGGNNNSGFSGVAAAPDGSIYVSGSMYGSNTFDFGNGVTAAGTISYNNSMLLVKYNSAGVAQWARTTVAGVASSLSEISVASDGSIYAAGQISGTGTYDFGNSVTAAAGHSGNSILLIKYDSLGAAQWAATVSAGSNESSFSSLAVASDGSIYAAGQVYGNGSFDFGNSVAAVAPYALSYNFLLVKYSSAGVAQWAQTPAAGSGSSYFYGVAAGPDGSVYAAGYLFGGSTFNFGNSITAAGGYSGGNLVVAKYNSSGVAQAARAGSGSDPSQYSGVTAAADGSVYAVGHINGSSRFSFGNGVTATGGSLSNNLLLVKYSN